MGLDFLLHYGGRRLRQYVEQPPLDSPQVGSEEEEGPKVTLDFELELDAWVSLPVASNALDPAAMPQRFIDGCHYGKTVTCLQDSVGHPIPVRLAEIGGVAMRLDGRSLRREFAHVERIVCSIIDPFPWHEVEDFAVSLAEIDMRLLPALPPIIDEVRQLTYDYASMEQRTYTQAQVEMRVLEELALDQDPDTLTLVDGPLGRIEHARAIGAVKQHRKSYLHPQVGRCSTRWNRDNEPQRFGWPARVRPWCRGISSWTAQTAPCRTGASSASKSVALILSVRAAISATSIVCRTP